MTHNSKVVVSSEQSEESVTFFLDNLFKNRIEMLRTFSVNESLRYLSLGSLIIDGNENVAQIVEVLMREHVSVSDKWEEITGDPDFYIKLVTLMKEEPAKHMQKYAPAWDAAVNKFTAEFVKDFCFTDGRIDWEKLVRFVSGK